MKTWLVSTQLVFLFIASSLPSSSLLSIPAGHSSWLSVLSIPAVHPCCPFLLSFPLHAVFMSSVYPYCSSLLYPFCLSLWSIPAVHSCGQFQLPSLWSIPASIPVVNSSFHPCGQFQLSIPAVHPCSPFQLAIPVVSIQPFHPST